MQRKRNQKDIFHSATKGKRIGIQETLMHYLSRFFPKWVWLQYGRQAKRRGLRHLYMILSFDCDTSKDIAVAEEIDARLKSHGIKTTYAVPGVQLREGASVYRHLAEKGSQFINHGALPHTEYRDNRYWSVTFYGDMTAEEVVDDIREGHKIVEQVINRRPTGFRAPHFGLFQEPTQLSLLL